MKAAIIVGHNVNQSGAFAGDPIGESEYSFNSKVAKSILEKSRQFDIEIAVFCRKPQGGYAREIREVYRRIDDWEANLSLELHFNGAENPAATGCETFSSGTPESLILCEVLQEEMVRTLRLADRGVKVRTPDENGGLSLHSGKAPSALVEPFFGSNENDRIRAAELGVNGFAEMFLRGLGEYRDRLE